MSVSVRVFILSHMYRFEASRPIAIKSCLKHHWGRGKAALGFGPDQIRTLVSMATEISHMVIIGKNGAATFSQLFLIRSYLYLQVRRTCMKSRKSSKLARSDTEGGVRCP